MRRGLLLLAALLCLVVALAAPLFVSGSADVRPAPETEALATASNGQPTDRPQDHHSPNEQLPGEPANKSEDGSAKKLPSGFAVLPALFGGRNEDAGRKTAPVPIEVGTEGGSEGSPPQLLQRPPPAG